MALCSRCRSRLDPDCPHVGPVCCACAELEVRRLMVQAAEAGRDADDD